MSKQQKELEEKAKWFGELMAIIHRDGGHYLAEHGTEKSAKDAIARYYDLLSKVEDHE